MALTITAVKTLDSTDCQYALMTDQTGTYDAGTNPGGYGAPNPERNDIAVFLIPKIFDAVTREINTLAANVVTAGNDQPLSATDWTVSIEEDAYYAFDMAYVNTELNGLPVNTGAYIYDTVNQQLYRSTIDSNNTAPSVDDTNWAAGTVSDPEFDAYVVAQNQSYNADTIVLCRAEDGYQQFTSEYAENILVNPNTNCACIDRNRAKWERLHVLYNGAIAQAAQDRYTVAGTTIKALSDLLVDINCEDCRC